MAAKTMRAWVHGLYAALLSAIGDAGTAALGTVVFAPDLMQQAKFWRVIVGMVAFSALKTVFAYLKQSPLPGGEE